MEKPKRFHLIGRVRPSFKPKESDGVDYDLGQFDSLLDAEAVKGERLSVGWGTVVIVDSDASPEPPGNRL